MRTLKTILFHILYTFRPLILICFKLMAGLLFLFVFLLEMTFSKDIIPLATLASWFVLGVGFSALAWYYDVLILKLQPSNTELFLYK